MKEEMSENGMREVFKFDWDEPARKCVGVYYKTLAGVAALTGR